MRKLFKYLKPYWFLAIISPLMMMGEVLADLCQPKLMSIIVDCGILGGGDISESKIGQLILRIFCGEQASYSSMQVIISVGITMISLVVIGGFFGTFCAYTAARAAQGFGHDLRRDAYSKVMSLSIEQTDKFTTGSLVTRMTNDVTMITEFIEMILRMFVRSPIFFIGGAVMLLTINVSFGLVLLCALPILALTLFFVLSKATPFYKVIQKKLDKVNSVVQENVSGARVVKACVREDYECDRFDRANTELRDTNFRVLRILIVMQPVLNIIMNAAVVAIIFIGGLQAEAATASVGTIMAAITYVTQVIMSVMMISHLLQSVSRAVASAARVNEVLESEPVVVGGDEKEGRMGEDICVEFRNVAFRYPNTVGRPVLHDIDLTVKRGETLAVIGATGSGKTSLVNLIPRFYDSTEGDVFVDGVNVRDYDLTALRQKIGFVMQKSELFSDTIENNIRWGKPDADRDEVISAAETAQAADFISSFNEGYGGFISEKGASLSGGQKQRMSISRALVRKPEILILDDSTSALDLATEARLQKSLREKLADTTVIMIAQRIASVKRADRIAVIENGTITACASHDELLRTSETYRDIYSSQVKSGAYLGEEGNANE